MQDPPFLPAAERNTGPILDVVLPNLPTSGVVLEIASGMGQHIAALAKARPDLSFHPTEPDPARRLAIDARCAGLTNVASAQPLDACAPGWGEAMQVDVILLVNLLQLISDAQVAVLLDEVAQAVKPGGLFALYGPFFRADTQPSEGDLQFDAALRAEDPAIGLKEAEVIETTLGVLGFTCQRHEMPANNLMILARKAAVPGL